MIAATVGCGPSTPLAITSAAAALTCGADIEVPAIKIAELSVLLGLETVRV